MYKIICLIFVVAAVARSDDLDDTFTHIFGPQPTQQNTQSSSPVNYVKTYSPCKLKDGSMGKCLPYYQCDANSGGNPSIAEIETSECESFIDLCC